MLMADLNPMELKFRQSVLPVFFESVYKAEKFFCASFQFYMNLSEMFYLWCPRKALPERQRLLQKLIRYYIIDIIELLKY